MTQCHTLEIINVYMYHIDNIHNSIHTIFCYPIEKNVLHFNITENKAHLQVSNTIYVILSTHTNHITKYGYYKV